MVREEAISVGLWPWPVEAAYSRRTNHQFTLVVLISPNGCFLLDKKEFPLYGISVEKNTKRKET
ncbi:hypothetical protein, partial [Streptococcus pneumoniae]|uniref:hypothetical protein n=1 Tax=Streptococcus pneumoniae TaxID=1313 RepID=UPI001CECF40E